MIDSQPSAARKRRVKRTASRRRAAVTDITVESLKTSSAHGISHAANASNRVGRRFWTTVASLCAVAMFLQIASVVDKFFSHEKAVNIVLNFEQAPFPAVTICNLNPYKKSLLSKVESARSTLDMMENAMQSTKLRRRRRAIINRPGRMECGCAFNEDTGERVPGACMPATGGADHSFPANYLRTECICIYFARFKRIESCYPDENWIKTVCPENECTSAGDCQMVDDMLPANATIPAGMTRCYCSQEFNRCVMGDDLVVEMAAVKQSATTTTPEPPSTTTIAASVGEAMGYGVGAHALLAVAEMTDSLAITTKGKENLVFATAALPLAERIKLSYTKDEVIQKCSYAGAQCDIETLAL